MPASEQPTLGALRGLRTLVSPYTGIVRETYELLNAPDDARLVRIGCDLTRGDAIVGPVPAFSGSTHHDRTVALAAALGEAAERYSAAWVPEDELRLASAEELGDEAVDPHRFALFSAEQYAQPRFPYERFTGATSVPWARGVSLSDGSPAWLPAELVYLNAPSSCATRIGYSTTNGLACAATREEAILGGLLESLERDAFMLTWSNRLALPRLDWSGDVELTRVAQRWFDPAGVAYAVVDLSAFWQIPTALAVVRGGAGDGCALAVGAASSATMQQAWQKALAEAFTVRPWARLLRARSPQPSFASGFADVRTFDDHVLLHAHPAAARAGDFLDGSRQTRAVASVAPLVGRGAGAQTRELLARLRAQGYDAYAVDVASPDVRAAGLYVVKVLVPELCPLDVVHTARFLGGRRLYHAAYEAGLRSAPTDPDELNPFPHPFP